MKLLEMTANDLCNELLELAGPISEIAEDQTLSDLLNDYREADRKKTASLMLVGKLWGRLIPILLNDHREAFLRIIASVNGKPVSDVLKMHTPEIVVNTVIAWKKEICPFFSLFTASERLKS